MGKQHKLEACKTKKTEKYFELSTAEYHIRKKYVTQLIQCY
jgi:hypothetical protein